MKRQKHRRDEHCEYRKLVGKSSDDSDNEETELFVKKPIYQEPPTVEKVVEEGDTLQSLAIRYGCSVAELKRLNHILNDNEIYAKGVVKVPDRPFSAILAAVHNSGRNSPNIKTAHKKENNLNNLESKLQDSLFLNLPNTSNNASFNEVIFNSTISTKTPNINNDDDTFLNPDEEITLLPKSSFDKNPVVSKFTCSGADADISWIALIILAVIVIVAVPLFYSFYIYEHPEQYHHHIVHNNHTS